MESCNIIAHSSGISFRYLSKTNKYTDFCIASSRCDWTNACFLSLKKDDIGNV